FPVFFCAGRFWRVGEDGFFVGWAFLEADILADARLEKSVAEGGANLFVSVAGNVGALIVESDDDAENLQIGIGSRANARISFEKIVGALDSEVSGLDRDEQVS